MPDEPVPLLGDAQGSFGAEALADAVGVAVGVRPGATVSDGVAAGAAGGGSVAALGAVVVGGVVVGDGEALDWSPHNAPVTGSVDGEALPDGVAAPVGSGSGGGLLDGRFAGFGPPPPSARAVAATDADAARTAALSARDVRVMALPP